MKTVEIKGFTHRVEIGATELAAAIRAEAPAVVNQPRSERGFDFTITRLAVASNVVDLGIVFDGVNPSGALSMAKGTKGNGAASVTVTPDGPGASILQGNGTFNIDGPLARMPGFALRKAGEKILAQALDEMVADFKDRGHGAPGGLAA
jgi:hypothetical protein